MYKSAKFNTGRKKHSITGEQKKSLSFNKFIKHADKQIAGDPAYDLISDFNFYDINCDNCLEKQKKIVTLYVMETDEIKRKLGRGELISSEDADLFVKCPNCFQVKRVTDIRKLTSGGTIPTIESMLSTTGHIGSSTSDRNKLPIESFPAEVRKKYYDLLNSKDANPKYAKELENYVKEYANTVKQLDPSFKTDYGTLISSGKTITKVENVNI